MVWLRGPYNIQVEGKEPRQRIMAHAHQHSRAAHLSNVVDLTEETDLHEQGNIEIASKTADASKADIMSQALQAITELSSSVLPCCALSTD